MNIEEFIRATYDSQPANRGQIRIECPECGHHSHKCYIDFTKSVYNCFNCGTGGSLKSFMFYYHGAERGVQIVKPPRKPPMLNKGLVIVPDDFVRVTDSPDDIGAKHINYMLKRFIPYDIIKSQRFGYARSNPNYTIFPIYDECGNQVYYTGISIVPTKLKSLFPPSTEETFGKSDVLFNINRAKFRPVVYIVEGIMDCLSMLAVGVNCVASLGKTLSQNQISVLRACGFTNIVVCYDGAAIQDSWTAAEKLAEAYCRNIAVCELPVLEDGADDPNDLLKKYKLYSYINKTVPYSPLTKIKKLNELNNRKTRHRALFDI